MTKKWVQVEAFRRRLADYQTRTGASKAEVAERLGTTPGTLKQWTLGKSPKRSNLQAIASLFGCSITEFLDDPNPAGGATDLSEAKQLVARMVFYDLSNDQISDEQALAYYRAWKAVVEAGAVKNK